MSRKFAWGIVFAIGLACPIGAGVIVDGRLDPSEGYSAGYQLDLTVEGYGLMPDAGQLWVHQDAATHDVFVALSFPLTLVDNTYGANAIGWGSSAPSGKNHNFNDLKGSDSARFRLEDGLGDTVFDFELDYISDAGAGVYQSLGASGGDGDMYTGNESSLLEFGTSLDYNFNTLGHTLTVNSPATDTNYTENLDYQGWEFAVTYEARIDGALFANGLGGVTVPIAHISPNKIGKNKVYPVCDGPPSPPPDVIPEPTTLLLFGSAAAALYVVRRRRDCRKA